MTVGRCRWIATQYCCKKKRLDSESLNKKKGEGQIDLKIYGAIKALTAPINCSVELNSV
jgi:hypothetical protein